MKYSDINHIDINLWGQLMGKLAVDSKGVGFFKYAPEFVETGLQPAPITMPVTKDVIYSFPRLNLEVFHGLPGMISDSLPDAFGNRLLDIHFKKLGIKNEFNRTLLKLCYINHKATGALEFTPPLPSSKPVENELILSDLMHTVDQLISSKQTLNAGDLNNIQDIISIGSSLGGAVPKAVIGIDFNSNSIKPGNIPLPDNYDYWIIKFDALKREQGMELSEPLGYGNVEYTYYEMATKAGIAMSPCKLLKDGDRYHFLTKRFDRVGNQKLHLQSLNAIAHADSYQLWDYDIYFKVLTKLKANYADHEQLYKRIVFNGLAGNTDTHTKNTSFLMNQKGEWKLSPFYDVICGVSRKYRSTENHKTLINGKTTGFTYTDFVSVAEKNGIKNYKEIIDQVNESLDGWLALSQKNNVKKAYQQHVQSVIDLNRKNLASQKSKI